MVDERPCVLVSVAPEFADLIAAGTKTVELRRRFPAMQGGGWLVLYATQPVGAVIGMSPIRAVDQRPPGTLWTAYSGAIGIGKDLFDKYFAGCTRGSAIQLGDFVALRPVSGDDMKIFVPGFRPPQSYRYLRPAVLRCLAALSARGGHAVRFSARGVLDCPCAAESLS